MGKLVIATPIISDAAAITGSAAATDLGLENLQVREPKVDGLTRLTDYAAAFFEVDLGSAQAVNLLALLAHNISATGTVRVRGATSQANLTAAPGYDSGLLAGRSGSVALPLNMFLLWLGDSPETYRWWRVDIADGSNPNLVVDIGRLYISNAWQPSKNFKFGWGPEWVDPSRTSRSRGGAGVTDAVNQTRTLRFELPYIPDAEFDNAFDIDRLRGGQGDVLIIPDPDTASRLQQTSVYGLLKSRKPITRARQGYFRKRYELEGLIGW